MKKEVKQIETDNLLLLKSKQSRETLKRILSPLEAAVLRHNYQPFKFNMNGVTVYISGAACKRMVGLNTQKVELLNWAITKDKLAKGIPFKLREVFDDPRIVLSLNPSVRNRLCRLECYTLFSIMKRGRSYFIEHKFGKAAMDAINELFVKHNCNTLFK